MRQLYTKTDKHYIATLPRYAFEGKIVVIKSVSEAERAVRALRMSPILGIDTETRPAFRKGQSHKVALLQIANEELCFLFRLNEMGFPACLSTLLSDQSILKVGLSLHDDFLMLRQRDSAFRPGNCVDLQDVAKQMGMEDMSWQKLYANVFQQRISKGARLSNWEADVLTEAQKVYAATDAVTCIHLYKELMALKQSGEYELISDNLSASQAIQK